MKHRNFMSFDTFQLGKRWFVHPFGFQGLLHFPFQVNYWAERRKDKNFDHDHTYLILCNIEYILIQSWDTYFFVHLWGKTRSKAFHNVASIVRFFSSLPCYNFWISHTFPFESCQNSTYHSKSLFYRDGKNPCNQHEYYLVDAANSWWPSGQAPFPGCHSC